MKQYKTYKFRLYPNEEQSVLINKTIGCSRFVFNHFLELWNTTYKETKKGLSYGKCSAIIPKMKKEEETIWLKEVDSISLQSSVRDLADAFDGFFKNQTKYPKFKSKNRSAQTYTTKMVNNNISVENSSLKLPKLGLVRFAKSREVEGRIMSATVRRNPSGKYFVSILCEKDINAFPKTDSSIGIDVGLKDFAILSNNTIYPNPRFFNKVEKKLAKEQKILSRRMEQAKKEGRKLSESKNYQKQRIKVARIHETIVNKRTDYLQKISTEIIKNHDIIGIEDLKISDMVQNKVYSKGISKVSWGKFRSMLEYKANWYGKKVIAVARNFPSSQLCSNCGFQNKAVKDARIREWICPECQTHHDRDLNASINLEKEALRVLSLEP